MNESAFYTNIKAKKIQNENKAKFYIRYQNMNKHCSYRGKNIAFVILFLIHLINNFTCIYSAKPDHCLPSAKCLVCEDENIMKEIDSCKTCCETESIGQCSDACTECFCPPGPE